LAPPFDTATMAGQDPLALRRPHMALGQRLY
jgi:hypothetical protein